MDGPGVTKRQLAHDRMALKAAARNVSAADAVRSRQGHSSRPLGADPRCCLRFEHGASSSTQEVESEGRLARTAMSEYTGNPDGARRLVAVLVLWHMRRPTASPGGRDLPQLTGGRMDRAVSHKRIHLRYLALGRPLGGMTSRVELLANRHRAGVAATRPRSEQQQESRI